MTDQELLRETLASQERALQAERQRRTRAEALLSAQRELLAQADAREARLLTVTATLLRAEHALLLRLEGEVWVPVAATHEALMGGQWADDAMLQSALLGQPMASFDLSVVPSWATQADTIRTLATSALHIGVQVEDTAHLLIALHPARAHFGREQVRDARQLSIIAAQTLLAQRHHVLRRDQERLVAAQELDRQHIAALQLARDEALAASRVKSQFLANISHELRTPLNAIIGYTELLIEATPEEDPQEALPDLRNVQRASHHLLALINDVLDLSKVEAGRVEPQLGACDIDALMEELARVMAPLLGRQGNRLNVQHEATQVRAHTDAQKLRQIVLNLLSNANKFTHGGDITLRAWCEGDTLWFSVRDTGIGIAPETQERIFNAFEQLDGGTTRRYEGTGLGLAISKRYSAILGGKLSVESAPGEGSTFTLSVPLALPDAVAPSA